YQEIAQSMEMRVEAVKSLLYRAREKVREMLNNYLRSEVSNEVDL
ncbi:MAG: RNA polymerase sigma factor, partial [Planctomycetes bacterium]|nr:RNA polymerase sigma factor [Planctomycetota bacterium]